MRSAPESLTSADVRAHNLGLVLLELDRAGAASRTELAEATGLVRGAITSLVAELIGLRLVRPFVALGPAPSAATRAGRPQERLELDGGGLAILGLEFSRDTIGFRLVDLGGRTLAEQTTAVRVPFGDPDALADLLATLCNDAAELTRRDEVRIIQLVVVVSAPVHSPTQVIPAAIDFGWTDVDLPRLLADRIAPPPLGVRIVNDANASAYAEFDRLQADAPGERVTDIVYVKSDTGIGGGAIVSGRILEGAHGYAFEPGHAIVKADGDQCSCGKRGCLVTVAGPDVVLHDAGLDEYTRLNGHPAALDELMRRVERGDEAAVNAISAAGEWIRMSLTNLVMLFQPQYVVLGGYLAQAVEMLSDLPEQALQSLRASDSHDAGDASPLSAIRAAAYPDDSAMRGALMIGRRTMLAEPDPLRRVIATYFTP